MKPLEAGDGRSEAEKVIDRVADLGLQEQLAQMLRSLQLIRETPRGAVRSALEDRLHAILLTCMAARYIELSRQAREPVLRRERYKVAANFLWHILEMPVTSAAANALCDEWRPVLEGVNLATGAPEA